MISSLNQIKMILNSWSKIYILKYMIFILEHNVFQNH